MPKKMFNKEEKYNMERIMAATFITEKIGYSFRLNKIILKKKNFEINPNIYTNTMTSVIRNVYRKIESFLQTECKRKVKPISADEFHLIRSPLIQVRQWLYADQLQTFYKFVRMAYNLSGDLDISHQKANLLYGQIILTLEKQTKIDVAHLKKNRTQPCIRRPAANYYNYRTFQNTIDVAHLKKNRTQPCIRRPAANSLQNAIDVAHLKKNRACIRRPDADYYNYKTFQETN